MQYLRKSGTSISIFDEDMDYGCNVLFLWSKKNHSVVDAVKRHATEVINSADMFEPNGISGK